MLNLWWASRYLLASCLTRAKICSFSLKKREYKLKVAFLSSCLYILCKLYLYIVYIGKNASRGIRLATVAGVKYLKTMVMISQPRLRDLGHGYLMATVTNRRRSRISVTGPRRIFSYICIFMYYIFIYIYTYVYLYIYVMYVYICIYIILG